jgi:hypothetical protein
VRRILQLLSKKYIRIREKEKQHSSALEKVDNFDPSNAVGLPRAKSSFINRSTREQYKMQNDLMPSKNYRQRVHWGTAGPRRNGMQRGNEMQQRLLLQSMAPCVQLLMAYTNGVGVEAKLNCAVLAKASTHTIVFQVLR